MPFTNRKFTWDFNALNRFYNNYVIKWINSSMSWTAAQMKQARANLGFGNGDIDTTPTAGSDNLVKSGGIYDSIETISQFKPIPVSVLPTPSAETMNKLYVTPKTNGFTGDNKDEWYTIESPGTADYECDATKEERGIILLMGGEFIALDSTSAFSGKPCIAEYTGSGPMEVEDAEEGGYFTVIFPLEEGMTFESKKTGKQYVVDSNGLFVEAELKDYSWEKMGDHYGVSYKPQTLTSAEKAQVQSNIDVYSKSQVDSKVNNVKTFYAVKGTTQYAPIVAALEAGCTVYCYVNGILWPVLSEESNRINFVSPEGTSQTYITSGGAWGGISQRSIDKTPTENSSKVVTSGGVHDAIKAVGKFAPTFVDTLPTASAETMNKLYVTPKTNGMTNDTKDEWYTIESPRTAEYDCYATKEEMGETTLAVADTVALDSTSSLGCCIAEFIGSTQMSVEDAENGGYLIVIITLSEGDTFESDKTGKQYVVDSNGLFVEAELKDYSWEKMGDHYEGITEAQLNTLFPLTSQTL